MAYAKFKPHQFSYLNIASIGSDYVLQGSDCGLVCVNIPSCFSFNLGAFRNVIGKVICELLPSDIYNNSEKFVLSQSHHHYSVAVSGNSLRIIFPIAIGGWIRQHRQLKREFVFVFSLSV